MRYTDNKILEAYLKEAVPPVHSGGSATHKAPGSLGAPTGRSEEEIAATPERMASAASQEIADRGAAKTADAKAAEDKTAAGKEQDKMPTTSEEAKQSMVVYHQQDPGYPNHLITAIQKSDKGPEIFIQYVMQLHNHPVHGENYKAAIQQIAMENKPGVNYKEDQPEIVNTNPETTPTNAQQIISTAQDERALGAAMGAHRESTKLSHLGQLLAENLLNEEKNPQYREFEMQQAAAMGMSLGDWRKAGRPSEATPQQPANSPWKEWMDGVIKGMANPEEFKAKLREVLGLGERQVWDWDGIRMEIDNLSPGEQLALYDAIMAGPVVSNRGYTQYGDEAGDKADDFSKESVQIHEVQGNPENTRTPGGRHEPGKEWETGGKVKSHPGSTRKEALSQFAKKLQKKVQDGEMSREEAKKAYKEKKASWKSKEQKQSDQRTAAMVSGAETQKPEEIGTYHTKGHKRSARAKLGQPKTGKHGEKPTPQAPQKSKVGKRIAQSGVDKKDLTSIKVQKLMTVLGSLESDISIQALDYLGQIPELQAKIKERKLKSKIIQLIPKLQAKLIVQLLRDMQRMNMFPAKQKADKDKFVPMPGRKESYVGKGTLVTENLLHVFDNFIYLLEAVQINPKDIYSYVLKMLKSGGGALATGEGEDKKVDPQGLFNALIDSFRKHKQWSKILKTLAMGQDKPTQNAIADLWYASRKSADKANFPQEDPETDAEKREQGVGMPYQDMVDINNNPVADSRTPVHGFGDPAEIPGLEDKYEELGLGKKIDPFVQWLINELIESDRKGMPGTGEPVEGWMLKLQDTKAVDKKDKQELRAKAKQRGRDLGEDPNVDVANKSKEEGEEELAAHFAMNDSTQTKLSKFQQVLADSLQVDSDNK